MVAAASSKCALHRREYRNIPQHLHVRVYALVRRQVVVMVERDAHGKCHCWCEEDDDK